MVCAILLARKGQQVTIFDRNERLGRKLSATGNGQGNVTNLNMNVSHYFSDDLSLVKKVLNEFSEKDTIRFLEDCGGIFLADQRGRVYPSGRQASAITDLLRHELERLHVTVRLSTQVTALNHNGTTFQIYADKNVFSYDDVVLAAGGCAAPNFGTDGSAYTLAKRFGHHVTECRPALVQLKTDPNEVRGLKGIRVDGIVRLKRNEKTIYDVRGDILFTESGLSGDAVFRASSYAQKNDRIEIDLLPDVPKERLISVLNKHEGADCLLCVVNNGLGRTLFKRANGDKKQLVTLLKTFPCTVSGTLGFPFAQVTRGGIPLAETTEYLMSRYQKGLYLAGEILNVDGECGGYNLQWAFSSAYTVSKGILC